MRSGLRRGKVVLDWDRRVMHVRSAKKGRLPRSPLGCSPVDLGNLEADKKAPPMPGALCVFRIKVGLRRLSNSSSLDLLE